MRVHLDNFDVSPTEFARLWVEQNRYIDHLESRLREAEEEMLQIKVAKSQTLLCWLLLPPWASLTSSARPLSPQPRHSPAM